MASQNQNLKYCTDTINLKKEIEQSFLTLGEHLYNIKRDEMFLPQWSSWDEYVTEIKMSLNMANKLIQIYETFILEYKFAPEDITTAGGWTVVAEILPVIENRDDAENWLNMASELTRDDLRKEVKEAKSGVEMATCAHADTYIIRICRCCGNKEEIYEA